MTFNLIENSLGYLPQGVGSLNWDWGGFATKAGRKVLKVASSFVQMFCLNAVTLSLGPRLPCKGNVGDLEVSLLSGNQAGCQSIV